MNFRLGFALASSLALVAGACASSGGSTDTGTTPGPTMGGEVLAQGERPRENDMTNAAAEHLEQAAEAEEAGNTSEASTHFSQALQSADQAITADPRNPLPWLQGARANLGLDNYAAADSMLDEAEELRPIYQLEIEPLRERTWIALYQEAAPMVNTGDYEAAVPFFEGANAIYQGRPEVMITLGQIYAQLGEYDKAIPVLRMAVEVAESPEAREGLDSATVAGWDEQIETIPVLIAQSLMSAGRYDEAISELRTLLARDPDDLSLVQSLASLYVQTEQPDSARAVYDQLLQRTDLSPTDHYQVGVGMYQLSDYDAAADAFQQAAAAQPRDRDAAEMWARSLQIGHPQGDTDTPAAVLEELKEAATMWTELDPYSRNAHLVLAQTEQRLGNQATAGEIVNRIEDFPVSVEDLQLRRTVGGGGTVSGSIQNLTAAAGSSVTIEVTFFGQGGAVLGTQSATVQLPAQEARQVFQVDLMSDQAVTGYTYELQM